MRDEITRAASTISSNDIDLIEMSLLGFKGTTNLREI